MRMVTLRLPKDLIKEIKILAAETGYKLGDTYELLLKKGLKKSG